MPHEDRMELTPGQTDSESLCQETQRPRDSMPVPPVPAAGPGGGSACEERPADPGHPAREQPLLPGAAQHAHPRRRPPGRPQPFIYRGPSRFPVETAPLHAGKPLPWPAPSLRSTARRGKEAFGGSAAPGQQRCSAPRGSPAGRRVCGRWPLCPGVRRRELGSSRQGAAPSTSQRRVSETGPREQRPLTAAAQPSPGRAWTTGITETLTVWGFRARQQPTITLDGTPGPSRAEAWPRPLP